MGKAKFVAFGIKTFKEGGKGCQKEEVSNTGASHAARGGYNNTGQVGPRKPGRISRGPEDKGHV